MFHLGEITRGLRNIQEKNVYRKPNPDVQMCSKADLSRGQCGCCHVAQPLSSLEAGDVASNRFEYLKT